MILGTQGDTDGRGGPEMYRCDCQPINGKVEGQKAAVFGALHNHNDFFTSEICLFIQFDTGVLFEMGLICVAGAAK